MKIENIIIVIESNIKESFNRVKDNLDLIENFEKRRKSKFSKKNFDAIPFGNVNHSKFSINKRLKV